MKLTKQVHIEYLYNICKNLPSRVSVCIFSFWFSGVILLNKSVFWWSMQGFIGRLFGWSDPSCMFVDVDMPDAQFWPTPIMPALGIIWESVDENHFRWQVDILSHSIVCLFGKALKQHKWISGYLKLLFQIFLILFVSIMILNN